MIECEGVYRVSACMKCSVQGKSDWKQSCVGDSTTVVLNLFFTVLGVKGMGRNHGHTLYIIIGLYRDLLLPWCSVGQFLAPLLFTATAGAVFCSRPPLQIPSQNQVCTSSGLGETTCPAGRAW